MKVAIDCRSLRKTPSGIPNFLVTAINGLVKQNPEWIFYLITNESFNKEHERKLSISKNVNIIIRPLPILKSISFLWYIFKLPFLLKKIQPNIFWAPAFLLPPFIQNKITTLVTVHDMVFKKHKETMSFINRLFFELLHDKSVRQADLLWVNSSYTKEEVEEFFPERSCKNIFVGFFINTDIYKKIKVSEQEKESVLHKYCLSSKFILFVGTLEPRKNLEFLLSLMPDLVNFGYSLLVIGAKGWGNTNIKDIIEQQNFPTASIRFAGFVSTEELITIYNIASVYVSTSYNEGFGMPQLEAMACGCPVVSPHNSAMIEVVEDAGETVKTWENDDWIKTIIMVDANRDDYIRKGFKRVESFNRDYVIQSLSKYILNYLSYSS
ncbi:glycosyltransferase family 4 protein [Pontibacter silvestris]|uniref:Glycosyltransferase family 4 protein n=1 Tax=Pontibacter silvestris TaxID=2305183 RepID=A0ABW4WZS6_9BACT|nr:glycosyltransferase family 1 protein [Pontibacter silvestris]MCC9135131.1 glycosyltransferase family 4 protein [Pontibacter silvestris]